MRKKMLSRIRWLSSRMISGFYANYNIISPIVIVVAIAVAAFTVKLVMKLKWIWWSRICTTTTRLVYNDWVTDWHTLAHTLRYKHYQHWPTCLRKRERHTTFYWPFFEHWLIQMHNGSIYAHTLKSVSVFLYTENKRQSKSFSIFCILFFFSSCASTCGIERVTYGWESEFWLNLVYVCSVPSYVLIRVYKSLSSMLDLFSSLPLLGPVCVLVLSSFLGNDSFDSEIFCLYLYSFLIAN